MAKNDYDNRMLLAEAAVANYTLEELVNAAVGYRMEAYENADCFHGDWLALRMGEKLAGGLDAS